jgi:hypothetical protein
MVSGLTARGKATRPLEGLAGGQAPECFFLALPFRCGIPACLPFVLSGGSHPATSGPAAFGTKTIYILWSRDLLSFLNNIFMLFPTAGYKYNKTIAHLSFAFTIACTMSSG